MKIRKFLAFKKTLYGNFYSLTCSLVFDALEFGPFYP